MKNVRQSMILNGKPIFTWDNWAQNCARTVVAYLVFSSARERLYLTYPSVKDTAQEVILKYPKDLNLPVLKKMKQPFSMMKRPV